MTVSVQLLEYLFCRHEIISALAIVQMYIGAMLHGSNECKIFYSFYMMM